MALIKKIFATLGVVALGPVSTQALANVDACQPTIMSSLTSLYGGPTTVSGTCLDLTALTGIANYPTIATIEPQVWAWKDGAWFELNDVTAKDPGWEGYVVDPLKNNTLTSVNLCGVDMGNVRLKIKRPFSFTMKMRGVATTFVGSQTAESTIFVYAGACGDH
jgi:hypothetical protein